MRSDVGVSLLIMHSLRLHQGLLCLCNAIMQTLTMVLDCLNVTDAAGTFELSPDPAMF